MRTTFARLLTAAVVCSGCLARDGYETRSGDHGAGACGDDNLDATEICDDGNTVTESECPYGTATCVACDALCANELNLVGNVCGDNVASAGNEICDGTDVQGESCFSQTGLTEGQLRCLSSCQGFDTSECTNCGNGTLDAGEECDEGVDTPTCRADCTFRPGILASGGYHSCLVGDAGGLQCWGGDANGQIGDGGTNTNQYAPVDVVGIDGASSSAIGVSAGSLHTCALLDSGAVSCWGWDANGQLGDGGTNTDQSTPVPVVGIDGVARVAVAVMSDGRFHNCALLSNGAIQCWGSDDNGQLGDGGANVEASTPVDVVGIDGTNEVALSVASGRSGTCALLVTGAVKCWGRDNAGQVGDGGTNADQGAPVDVVGIDGVAASAVAITKGGYFTCAVLDTGAVKCWGSDDYGQLGDGGANLGSSTPVDVVGLDGNANVVTAIAAGWYHVCALLDTGAVKCWGRDDTGQLGDGGADLAQGAPADVVGIDGVAASAVMLAPGGEHTCVLLSTGAVRCWGSDNNGQLGDG